LSKQANINKRLVCFNKCSLIISLLHDFTTIYNGNVITHNEIPFETNYWLHSLFSWTTM